MVSGKILFNGIVIDSDDDKRLGRLRVKPDEELLGDIKASIVEACKDPNNVETGLKKDCEWKENDPYLILPLLPFTISITPKPKELVYILYPYVQDPSSPSRYLSDRNKYYIPVSPSTPLSVVFENSSQTKTNMVGGENYKQQSSLKQPNGEIALSTRGIFPEPEDNSLLGRGTSDLILKQDSALLRAGKTNDLVGPTTTLPTSNDKRAFVELTSFSTKKTKLPPKPNTKSKLDIKKLILLVEYDIVNPENEQDSFTGNIYLYNINKKGLPDSINTKDFKVDTDVENYKGAQLPISYGFIGKSSKEVVSLINDFIRGLNKGKIEVYGKSPFNPEPGKQFPFAFRPSPSTYKKMVDAEGGPIESNNIYSIFQKIGISDGSSTFGFGVVSAKDITGPLLKLDIKKYRPIATTSENVTYGTIGAQKIFLLSHDSQIGVNKIDLKNTIYGITQDKYLDIVDKTEPLIRGDKMMDLMNLVVKFLLSHVHPYHGLAPVPVGQDGTKSADILQKLLDAPNTILNQEIRIN